MDQIDFANLKAGDDKEYTKLFHKYEKDLKRFLLSRVIFWRDDLYDDVIQDTFITLFININHFDNLGDGAFLNLLFTIAYRIALKYKRKQKSLNKKYEQFSYGFILFFYDHVTIDQDRISVYEAANDMIDLINKVCMNPQVVLMHTLNGMTFQELGTYFGIPRSTIFKQYSKDIKILRTHSNLVKTDFFEPESNFYTCNSVPLQSGGNYTRYYFTGKRPVERRK